MPNNVRKEGNVYGVYAITVDGIPGKVYIGYTNNFENRFKEHTRGFLRGHGPDMYVEFRKENLSRKDIRFHILAEKLTYDEARSYEAEKIVAYKSYDERYGWNRATEVSHLKNFNVDRNAPPLPKEAADEQH